ncbi:MAG: hypothetical protein CSB32_00205 [Desulfobacterales bacterium]|nr:MAG: hypothetical protein CSB32_00205 [Desulfobacterales bacterium]
MEHSGFIRRGLVLSVVFVGLYHFLVTNLAIVDLQITTDTRTLFKIYYSDDTKAWSERRAGVLLISPKQQHYSLRLSNLKRIRHLRIDPAEKPATVTVASMVFSQPGFVPLKINSLEQFQHIKPGGGVDTFTCNEDGLRVTSTSNDPNLFLQMPPLEPRHAAAEQLLRLLVLVALAFALAYAWKPMFENCRIVVYAGGAVAVLILLMAVLSGYNQHPDEMVHIKAAEYYINHSSPPAVEDAEIADTYSRYGVSRLNSGEIAYFFAGKFARLLAPLHLPNYLTLRLFNLGLFCLLIVGAAYSNSLRIVCIPLLLSPQIWYIFSYFNSEAFALTITILVAYQMVVPVSAWNRLLTAGATCRLSEVLWIVFLLGMLLLTKLNFYFFGLYLFFYFLWRLFFRETVFSRRNMLRVFAVALAGLSVFALVRGYQSYVNDFEMESRLLAAREQYADPLFKPSTPLDKKFALLQMKDRGVELKTILLGHRWGERIFRSSFGEYGYTSVAASYNYYDMVRWLGLVALAVMIFFSVKDGGLAGTALVAITVGSGLLLLAAACYAAWTADFQAQGRYLLPIVGMCSIFAFQMRKQLANLPCLLVLCALFLIASYSFILVALAGIPKLQTVLG